MQVAADNYSDLCIYQNHDIYNPFYKSYLVHYLISTKQFLVKYILFSRISLYLKFIYNNIRIT